MNVEHHQPASREDWLNLRRNDVTSSEIGCFLDPEHPWATPLKLWAEKTGKHLPLVDDNPVMRRGRKLEKLGVEETTEQLPQAVSVKHNSANEYWRDSKLRIGATPDLLIVDTVRGTGVVELKNPGVGTYAKKWANGEPPLYIALQVLTAAKLVGANWAAVGALRVGDFNYDFDLIDVKIHSGAWSALTDAVGNFWLSVERDTPPAPDYGRERDRKILMQLAGPSDGSTVDLSGDNELIHALHERERVKPLLDSMEFTVHSLDALIKHKMGAAEVAIAGDFRVTLKSHEKAGYMVKPSIQRPLKVKRLRESVP